MEITLITNNQSSIEKIIALAKKLNVTVERKDTIADEATPTSNIKDRIRNFHAESNTSFGDASEWQRKERNDRDLPFSR